jgi:hypothetical protein
MAAVCLDELAGDGQAAPPASAHRGPHRGLTPIRGAAAITSTPASVNTEVGVAGRG